MCNEVPAAPGSNAAEGPVMPTPVQKSPAVLPVVYESVAMFSRSFCEFRGFRWRCQKRPPAAGRAAELAFSLRLAIPLAAGAQIRLVLKDYHGASKSIPIADVPLLEPGCPDGVEVELEENPYGCLSNDACRTLDYTGKGSIPLAQWDGATQTMTLMTTNSIAANATVRMVVPSSAGISLPERGLTASSTMQHVTQFSMQVDSEFIPLSSFARLLPAVGAFHMFAIEFGNDVRPAEQISALVISLVPAMDLNLGDAVSVRLQDFGSSRDKSFVVAAEEKLGGSAEGVTWSVDWEMHTQHLTLSPHGRVLARSSVRLVLNQGDTGIFLIPPAEGTQVIFKRRSFGFLGSLGSALVMSQGSTLHPVSFPASRLFPS